MSVVYEMVYQMLDETLSRPFHGAAFQRETEQTLPESLSPVAPTVWRLPGRSEALQ